MPIVWEIIAPWASGWTDTSIEISLIWWSWCNALQLRRDKDNPAKGPTEFKLVKEHKIESARGWPDLLSIITKTKKADYIEMKTDRVIFHANMAKPL